MPAQIGVVEALRDWGLTVHLVPGHITRGSQDFNPRGHVCHHDVIPDQPGKQDHVPGIIINGRPDLDGPLANFWLEVDGDVHVVALGRANHAGVGSWRGLSQNSQVWGTEANNMGTPATPWPDEQLEAWYKLCKATCQFSDFEPAMVCGHKEWAPGRKSDPHSLNMDTFRNNVRNATKGDDELSAEEAKMIKDAIVNQSNQQEATMRAQGEKTRQEMKDQTDRLIAAFTASNEPG